MQRYSKLPKLPKIDYITTGRAVPVTHLRIHSVSKRLGPEMITHLVAEYQSGAPTTALMTKYGLGKGTVLRILDDHGVTRRCQPLSDEQVQQAIELYRQGWSLALVGKHLGRDGSLILRTLKRAGVARRDPHGRER